MSIILFLLVLFVLVLVHEWGHYIVAKKTGMQVDEFAIGFPPRLFSIKKGETEYSINLLPIGGYVRILGENPQTAGETTANPRSFVARPRWAQTLVLIAGVTMNVLFAWVLFFATFLIGVPTAVDESEASPEARLHITQVLPGSPLMEANIPPGAEVVSLSTTDSSLETLTPASFTEFVQAHASEALSLGYREEDSVLYKTVTPVTGLIPDDTERAVVGVSLVLVENQKQPFIAAVVSASGATVQGLKDITVGLYTLLRNTVRGTADFSDVAGPVGIVGLVGDAASYGITSLLMFTAMISLNLAVINLLPVPALDGGRLVFVAIEAITRRPLNPIWTIRLNLLGFALLMILMVVITWHDIAKLL
jgi:regulator of sigma E protease